MLPRLGQPLANSAATPLICDSQFEGNAARPATALARAAFQSSDTCRTADSQVASLRAKICTQSGVRTSLQLFCTAVQAKPVQQDVWALMSKVLL